MSDNEMTDGLLLQKVKNSDKKAFTILYLRHFDMLYSMSLRYLKNEDMAQDAVQQTFVKFWETRDLLEIKTSLPNYLYSVTKHYILNQIRHNNIVVAHHYQIAQTKKNAIEEIIGKIEKAETLEIFRRALQQLPDRHKKICILKMEEDMTNEQIAQRLKVSVSTVKQGFRQSKDLLRGYLTNVLTFFVLTILFF